MISGELVDKERNAVSAKTMIAMQDAYLSRKSVIVHGIYGSRG